MLTEKAKQQEDMIADLEEREKEYQELEAEMNLLRQQSDTSREELQALGRENQQLEEGIELMEKERKEMGEIKIKLERILAEAAYSLHRILMVSFWCTRFVCNVGNDGGWMILGERVNWLLVRVFIKTVVMMMMMMMMMMMRINWLVVSNGCE